MYPMFPHDYTCIVLQLHHIRFSVDPVVYDSTIYRNRPHYLFLLFPGTFSKLLTALLFYIMSVRDYMNA